MGEIKIVTVPWGDGSGENVSISYDPSASTPEYTALLSVTSPQYMGSTSRSKVIELVLERDPKVTAKLNVVQRKSASNVLSMEFKGADGSWTSTLSVNSDDEPVKVYVRASLTYTVYDAEGTGTPTVVEMTTANYGSTFVLSLGAGTPSFVSVGKDSEGVFVLVGKNTEGLVQGITVSCTYTGEYGIAGADGVLSLVSETFKVKSIELRASTDLVNYGSAVSVGVDGGTVGLRYVATVQLGDGSVTVKEFEVGSSLMGGTLSGALVGGTIPYSDYDKWRSVTVGKNLKAELVSYSLTWSWEGYSSTVVINQAAASIVTEVSRYLVLTIDPVMYSVNGGSGTYQVQGFIRMSNGTIVPVAAEELAGATVTSSVSWVTVADGTITVIKNEDSFEDRTCTLTASLEGYMDGTAQLQQEAVKELRRELELTLTPASFSADGGSGTYTVRGVIYMVDGTTEDGGDLTSSATVTSGASWLVLSNGTFTVGSYDSITDPREVVVTASLEGWLSDEELVIQLAKGESPWGAWTLTLTPTSYEAPAEGGGVAIAVVATRTREDGSESETKVPQWSGNDGFTAVTSGDGFTSGAFSLVGGTLSVVENTGTGTYSGSIVFGYEGATATFTVTQGSASISWGVPTGGVLTVVDISASGGSVSEGTLSGSITQVKTVNGEQETFTYTWDQLEPGTWGAVVSAPSLGTALKDRTQVGTLTYTYMVNGVVGSLSAAVYQEANVVESTTYGVPVVSVSAADVPASGGSVTSGTVSYLQTREQEYTSGSVAPLDDVTEGGVVHWSGGAVNIASLGTTVKVRSVVGDKLVATVTLNGVQGEGSVDVYQEANEIIYGALAGGAVRADDISAGGGSVGAVVTNMTQEVSFTSGATREGVVTHTQTTAVSAPSLGTTVKERTQVGSITVTFTGEGSKSATKTVDVYQEANVVTYGDVLLELSTEIVNYQAQYITFAASQTLSYTSGASEPYVPTVTLNESWCTIQQDRIVFEENTSFDDRYVTITAEGAGGKKSTAYVIQEQYTGWNVYCAVSNDRNSDVYFNIYGYAGLNGIYDGTAQCDARDSYVQALGSILVEEFGFLTYREQTVTNTEVNFNFTVWLHSTPTCDVRVWAEVIDEGDTSGSVVIATAGDRYSGGQVFTVSGETSGIAGTLQFDKGFIFGETCKLVIGFAILNS